MAEVKNAFIKSKMNKDLDSRLLPSGEYRDGQNIQVSKSEGEDVGALENAVGNLLAVDFNSIAPGSGGVLKSIGLLSDTNSSNIYIFLTTNTTSSYSTTARNFIYSYNSDNNTPTLLVQGQFLNFSQQSPIYGINVLEDLLFWTDNRNQPRVINITNALGNSSYYDKEDLISVAKYNPYQAIDLYIAENSGTANTTLKDVVSQNLPDGTANPYYNSEWPGDPDFLEDKFVSFSYRFKFSDGEYSIMAPFTQEAFIPKQDGYFLDGDEDGAYRSTIVRFMENKVNSVGLVIPLPYKGSELTAKLAVSEIDILYKESDSLNVKVLESIRSSDFYQSNDFSYLYDYQSRKPYKTLPESEIIRVYDKVPVKALGQEVIGNRVVYSNFQDKHTPPSFIDYDVAVTPKFAFSTDPTASKTSWTTSIVEYPEHTVKQNRNYQVGFVLSDRYGRQSTTILSPVGITTKIDGEGNIYGGSTYYHEYNPDPGTGQNTVNSTPGDSLKVLVNNPISATSDVFGWPGLYQPYLLADGTLNSEYNPLGWYSYKIVVKQTEQEYYNVYLPGILNGYPDYISSTGVPPDPENSIAHITLIGDNINKVPRNLTEVGPEQKQYGSEVQLFGRVTPENSPTPTVTKPYYPQVNSQTVVTISEQNNLFADANPVVPYGTIYQTDSNPYVARLSQNNVGNPPQTLPLPIGSQQVSAGAIPLDYNILLGVFETSPVESLLDIFWETSSSGLISDLNAIAGEDTTVSGFTNFTSNWSEGNGAGSNLTAIPFIPTFFAGVNTQPLVTSTMELLSVTRGTSNTDIKDNLFNALEKSTSPNGYDQYNITIKNPQVFVSTLNDNKYNFTFRVSGVTQAGEISGETTTTQSLYLVNSQPLVDNPNDVSVQDRTDFNIPIASFTGKNGAIVDSDNQVGLLWSISSTLSSLTIDENGNLYERTGNVSGGYDFTLTIKDAGGNEGSGIPGSKSKSYDLKAIFGADQIDVGFGSTLDKTIAGGIQSTGVYWGDFSNTSLIESTIPGLQTDIKAAQPNTKAPIVGTELPSDYFVLNPTREESSAFQDSPNSFDSPMGRPYSFGNYNYKSKNVSDSTLTKGTAYLTVNFRYDNFSYYSPSDTSGGESDFRPQEIQYGVAWVGYFQYRASPAEQWITATDVEGAECRIGGVQGNQIYPRNTGNEIYTNFQNTGFIRDKDNGETADGLSLPPSPLNIDSRDVAIAAAYSLSARASFEQFSPAPKAVFSKTFVFGKDQSYGNPSNDKFGEYRILIKYPQSARTGTFAAVLPTVDNSLNMAAFAKNNGALQTNRTPQVRVAYGDFYYPNTSQTNQTAYQYKVSSINGDDAQNASFQIPSDPVWAKEWSAKYITQLYKTSELRDVYSFSQDNKWHSYQPVGDVNDNSENFHAKYGINNPGTRSIGTDMVKPSSLLDGNSTNRRWVAQFSLAGLKVPKTAEPSTVTGETIGGES
jgi:hypothetical protein